MCTFRSLVFLWDILVIMYINVHRKKAMKFKKKSYKIHVFETRQIMSFVGKLHNGAETFRKSHYYGDVLRPLDLCMRLDQHQQNHEQQQDGTTTLILQPPPPHNQHLNLQTEKKTRKTTGEQNNLLRNFSLTPSPSSSSSFENEEEMGCVGPPPFTLYRRNPAPVKVKITKDKLPGVPFYGVTSQYS